MFSLRWLAWLTTTRGTVLFGGTLFHMEQAACSKCRQPNDRTNQRYCRSCHAAYAREHRKAWSGLSLEERKKVVARRLSRRLEREGFLIRQPCEVCGNTAVERHHPDYNWPYEVLWLCRKHHLELHQQTS